MSRLDDAGFGYWLAGFADGEGCFDIKPVGAAYICRFTIGLRADDLPILEEIQSRTGLGSIYTNSPSPDPRGYGKHRSVRWEVTRKADAMALVHIFDRFPLRAKKARDFHIWREAVIAHGAVKARRATDWTQIADLRAALRDQRAFDAPPVAA